MFIHHYLISEYVVFYNLGLSCIQCSYAKKIHVNIILHYFSSSKPTLICYIRKHEYGRILYISYK